MGAVTRYFEIKYLLPCPSSRRVYRMTRLNECVGGPRCRNLGIGLGCGVEFTRSTIRMPPTCALHVNVPVILRKGTVCRLKRCALSI